MTRHCTLALCAALFAAALAGEAQGQRYGRNDRITLPPSQAALVRILLNGVNANRRADAAERLGRTGDPRVIEALATAASNDPSREVRRNAQRAIRDIRGGNRPRRNDHDHDHGHGRGPGFFPPTPPRDPHADLVGTWYERYLGRSASAAELGAYTAMLRRGIEAANVQGALLGSGDFYQRTGGSPTGFVLGLYQRVLGRTPNRSEVANWLDRLRVHRGDRSRVAQEFLDAAQTELLRRQYDDPIIPW